MEDEKWENIIFVLYFSVFYKEHVFIKQKMKQKPKNKVVY